jgi:hypothetical protein
MASRWIFALAVTELEVLAYVTTPQSVNHSAPRIHSPDYYGPGHEPLRHARGSGPGHLRHT